VLRTIILLLALLPSTVFANETPLDAAAIKTELETNINVVWTCVAAFMVFLMQAGFAMLEVGFTRAKNAVNILMKNFVDFSVGSLTFYCIGFGLMFGASNGWFGDPLLTLESKNPADWNYTFLLFQTVFAATAATIVSGAIAERTRFTTYVVASVFITAIIYPIFGAWAWGSLFKGSGWLENLSTGAFCDFAGSTVVHSIGAWIGLAGAMVLGPRKGKFNPNGKPRAIPGHHIPMAALGVFILWFGWFGFNAGSTTVGNGEIGRIALVTNLSAAAAALSSMFTVWAIARKPDASMTMNGALAGLVAITAGCATVTPWGAIIIGTIAGVIVVFSVILIEKICKIDDPVGAISVHGVCGAFGTLACGLLNAEAIIGSKEFSTGFFYGGGYNQFISQLIGVVAGFGWAFVTGFILFKVLKATIGLRVSAEQEYRGLDIEEHGMEAYFQSK
jgi:ammonium transporter, Amt family